MLVFVAQSSGRLDLALIDDPFAFAGDPGLQQLPLLRPAHQTTPIACAGPAGSMPATRLRSPAMQRKVPESVGRLLRPDRTRHAEGPVVMGERLHDLRIPISSRSRNGWKPTASIPNESEGDRAPPPGRANAPRRRKRSRRSSPSALILRSAKRVSISAGVNPRALMGKHQDLVPTLRDASLRDAPCIKKRPRRS